MKTYLLIAYSLIIALVAVLIDNHTPINEAIAFGCGAGALALVPVVIEGWES
ncbi:MAG: hypothetical protein ABUJ92_00650 [Desulfobacterales bacterium]